MKKVRHWQIASYLSLLEAPAASCHKRTRPTAHRMAAAALSRAVLLALVVLRGIIADESAGGKHTVHLSQVGAAASSSFFGETVVNLTSGSDSDAPLLLESSLDEAESCDGVGQTVSGTAVLSGSVSGAFSLVGVNVTTLLHCGVRSDGDPVLDVTADSLEGPLKVSLEGGQEEKVLSAYSISASVYDDAETGGHFIAGTLRAADEEGGEIYWFDTCAGAFEVRTHSQATRSERTPDKGWLYKSGSLPALLVIFSFIIPVLHLK